MSAELTIGRLRGGYCVTWYEDGKRRRHQLKARTPKEAESEAVALFRRKQIADKPLGRTVAEIWEGYRMELGDKPTAKTIGYTGKAVLPFFGSYLPDLIDHEMCRSYARNRMDAGKSQGTVWTELGHLQSALKWAQKAQWIDRAPHIWKPSKPETDKRILNRGEARALIEAAEAPHIKLALTLLLGTAARVGAILDLTWDRVDFERGSINLRVTGAETRKGRAVVPMNGMVRGAMSTAHDMALSDYVIEYAGDRVGSIRKGVTGAIKRSGIGHVTIHELRHTAAVTMLSGGVALEMVAQMLGHSNTAITFKTYARYMPEHMQNAADVLDFTSLRKA